MSDDLDRIARLEHVAPARVAAGLTPDKRPATLAEIAHARAAKEESAAGTEEYDMREAKLAEIEDRQARPFRADQRQKTQRTNEDRLAEMEDLQPVRRIRL